MIFRSLASAALSVTAPLSAQTPAATVPVTLYSYGFAPNPIILRASQPVTIVFTNRSGSSHEFKAVSFFRSAKIIAGAAPEGEVELKPNQSVSLTIIPARGSYPVHCGHFFHSQLGMRTAIYVR